MQIALGLRRAARAFAEHVEAEAQRGARLLAGAGGCTAYDVVLILKRGRHDVRGCKVTLKAERASSDPKVFTAIHFHFIVTGKALKPEIVERAVALSHEKYCSATAMLAKTSAISTSFEVVEA